MSDLQPRRLTRRYFLANAAALPLAASFTGLAGVLAAPRANGEIAPPLPATPACDDGDEATPAAPAGPFYRPSSPERGDFTGDAPGEPLVLSGLVLSTRCRPLAGAVVDVWHADAKGEYDLEGFRLRGHQKTDDRGRWRFVTILPAEYGARTRHVHVKVAVPGRPVLTTELYFPGEPRNESDFLFRPELLTTVDRQGGATRARFDFVIEV